MSANMYSHILDIFKTKRCIQAKTLLQRVRQQVCATQRNSPFVLSMHAFVKPFVLYMHRLSYTCRRTRRDLG